MSGGTGCPVGQNGPVVSSLRRTIRRMGRTMSLSDRYLKAWFIFKLPSCKTFHIYKIYIIYIIYIYIYIYKTFFFFPIENSNVNLASFSKHSLFCVPLSFNGFLHNIPYACLSLHSFPLTVTSKIIPTLLPWFSHQYTETPESFSKHSLFCVLRYGPLFLSMASSKIFHTLLILFVLSLSLFPPNIIHRSSVFISKPFRLCFFDFLRCVQNKVGSILFTNISHRFLMYEFLCVLLTHLVFACFHAGLNMVELAIWAELFKSRLALILG